MRNIGKDIGDNIKKNIKDQWQRRKKVIIQLSFLLAGMLILSFTIGRHLLYTENPGLYSFALVNFAGYLFFLIMPVEALVPFYLAEGHAGLTIILLAVSTALLAQLIDYTTGNLASTKIINDLIGEKKYLKAEESIRKYGLLTVFIFNLLPLSSPIIVLVAGMLRLRLRKVLFYSFLGLSLKYIAIVYLFGLF